MADNKKIKKYLYIDISQKIVDDESSVHFFSKNKIPARYVFEGIRKAVEKPKHDFVLIRINKLHDSGWAFIQSLRRNLLLLKTNKLPIIVYLESGGLKEYYLASLADEIILTPSGTLDLTGFQAEVFFLKKAMEKVGLSADVVKTGDYKTFADMFTRDSISEPHKLMLETILDELLNQLNNDIQDSRKKLNKNFQELIDEAPFTANEALQSYLVDSLKYEEELEEYFNTKFDIQKSVEMPLKLYSSSRTWKKFYKPSEKIAIIYASGNIVEGVQRKGIRPNQNFITSKQMVKAIRKARNNHKIKAIVLRVNSPGGSALTSDIIWHEVKKAKEKKPVIVSMGNVAASGGYYISMGSDFIFTEGMTITGSIGVISGKLIGTELLNKLGINRETVTRGKNADLYSPFAPFTDEMRKKLEEQIFSFYYKIFLEKAAEGRKKEVGDIEKLAQGRVWTGIAAKEKGLVDQIGGLMEAIEEAIKRAHVKDKNNISYVILPKKKFNLSLSSLILESFSPLNMEIQTLLNWTLFFEQKNPLYLMPFLLKIT